MNKTATTLIIALLASGTAFAQSYGAQAWRYQTGPSIGQQYLNQQRQAQTLDSIQRDFRTFQQQNQMDRMLNRRPSTPYSTQGYRPYQFNY